MSRSALEKAARQSFNPSEINVQHESYMNVPYYVPNDNNFVPLPASYENEEDLDANKLPMYGNTTNFNINSLLYNNILENDYFRALYQLRTYHEVIGEIVASVTHVEPWQVGTSRYPSTAFCLLLKFLVMKLSVKQMNGLLNFPDSPYVRAIGALYLRYTCPPNEIWKWYEPYIEDDMEFTPFSDQQQKLTFGEYCIKLLSEMQYCGTTFPRIPVPIERKMKVLLLLISERKKRRAKNLENLSRLKVGAMIKAIYSDEENEPAWYDAVVDSIEEGRVWVTFPEYGNTECVDLGDIELVDKRMDDKRTESRDKRRSRSRERNKDTLHSAAGREESKGSDALLQQVIQSEREEAAAKGRNYGSRPVSYKGALSLKLDRYTRRSRTPERNTREKPANRNSRSRSRTRR